MNVKVCFNGSLLRSEILVQIIAELTEEQCAEKVKLREVEVTKKLKLQYEKEIKALTQRCIKDKQAVRIEVSLMGDGEVAKVFGV